MCIVPKRWSPCLLLSSRRHMKVKLAPLRLAGANFGPKKIHTSCQILTNLALCALQCTALHCRLRWQKQKGFPLEFWSRIKQVEIRDLVERPQALDCFYLSSSSLNKGKPYPNSAHQLSLHLEGELRNLSYFLNKRIELEFYNWNPANLQYFAKLVRG